MSPADARIALSMLGDAWFYGRAAARGALTPWERRVYASSAIILHRRGVAVATGTPVLRASALDLLPGEVPSGRGQR